MACGGKITKGGGMVVAIPFDATDVENLVVSVYTNGDEKIEKSCDDIRIGEGIIYVDMSKTDVDLLADGVVNYTMDYEIDGVQYSENGGTTNYIKTPKDYSATSITEVVQSAYTEGHEVGYQEGYEAGQQGSCNLQAKSQSIDGSGTGLWNIYPDAGYDGMERVTILDDGYGQAKYDTGYSDGYDKGQQDCPECSGGTSCNLTDTWIDLMEGDDFEGGIDYYASAITPSYDGWYKVHVQDKDYGQAKFDEGYDEGHYAAHLWDEALFVDTGFKLSANTIYMFDMWIEYSREAEWVDRYREFRLFSNINIETEREYVDIKIDDGAGSITMNYKDYNGEHTLSVGLHSRQVHFELAADENMNLSIIAVSGGKVEFASGSTDFRDGAGGGFLINAVYDSDRDTSPYVWINDETNISIDKFAIFNVPGDSFDYIYKYKNGRMICTVGEGADMVFEEQYYDTDDREWSTRIIPIDGCEIPCSV